MIIYPSLPRRSFLVRRKTEPRKTPPILAEDGSKRAKREEELDNKGRSLTESERTALYIINRLRDIGLVPKCPWTYQEPGKITISSVRGSRILAHDDKPGYDLSVEETRQRTISFEWGTPNMICYRKVAIEMQKVVMFYENTRRPKIQEDDEMGPYWLTTKIEIEIRDLPRKSAPTANGKITFEGMGAIELSEGI